MIDEVSFFDYQTVGPQSDLRKRIVNGEHVLDYRVSLTIDDDPRWIKLTAHRVGEPVSFIQLLSVAGIASITIKADPPAKAKK